MCIHIMVQSYLIACYVSLCTLWCIERGACRLFIRSSYSIFFFPCSNFVAFCNILPQPCSEDFKDFFLLFFSWIFLPYQLSLCLRDTYILICLCSEYACEGRQFSREDQYARVLPSPAIAFLIFNSFCYRRHRCLVSYNLLHCALIIWPQIKCIFYK